MDSVQAALVACGEDLPLDGPHEASVKNVALPLKYYKVTADVTS